MLNKTCGLNKLIETWEVLSIGSVFIFTCELCLAANKYDLYASFIFTGSSFLSQQVLRLKTTLTLCVYVNVQVFNIYVNNSNVRNGYGIHALFAFNFFHSHETLNSTTKSVEFFSQITQI